MTASVLVQAFVYLAVAAIAAPLAKRLGLGSVLGYLAAGVLIGPFALRLVGGIEDVANVAQFGVVILLFLIGLEVQPSLLWRLRTAIFGIGSAQVAATTAAFFGAALALGLDWRPALAVGAILSMSSTAIVLQLLEERGLRRGKVGAAAFGVLLFQDLAVIPILALLPLLGGGPAPAAGAHGGGLSLLTGAPAWAKALAGLAAVAVVVVGGRYLTRPIFRSIARARLRESFTASALLIVVGAAIVMQAVGLSAALGAFLAGVVLADSEFRREVETDIEPFRGLLLGLFFVTVGAGLNLPLAISRPGQIGLILLGLMAGKAAVMFVVGRLFRLDWREAGTTAAALCQGGEFIFVLVGYAVSVRVLAADLAASLTAAVALSMAATPLVVIGWERLSRPRASHEAPPDNEFDEHEPQAVVAGYGRFGQIVARVLAVNGFRVSNLDASVEQIALLRRFGRRVYYGDAGRLDLLRAAGCETAQILVVAIDDRERAREIVTLARESFPHLTVLARAFDRRHAYELLNAGAHVTERETFEGGLAMAAEALRALGWRAYRAERATRLFRRHDERLFESLRPLWGDEERYAVAQRESNPRMEDLLRADMARIGGPGDVGGGWDTTSLYDEIRERVAHGESPDVPADEDAP
jgi:glutathione-regulated potassium-efflux system ancillary protein KefC/glutathione-regulated potassium-efflux system protein KefB